MLDRARMFDVKCGVAAALCLAALTLHCSSRDRKPIVFIDSRYQGEGGDGFAPVVGGASGTSTSGAAGRSTGGTGASGGSGGTSGSAGSTGASGGSGGTDGGNDHTLDKIVVGGRWLETRFEGIGVDASGRVYVSDFDKLWVTKGDDSEAYLTSLELVVAAPDGSGAFTDVDSDPDLRVLVLSGLDVVDVSDPTDLEVVDTFDADEELYAFSAASEDLLVALGIEGLYALTRDGTELHRNGAAAMTSQDDLAVDQSGLYLHTTRGVDSPVSFGRISEGTFGEALSVYAAGNIASYPCLAADHRGGFYVVAIEADTNVPHLWRVTLDASDNVTRKEIYTDPSLFDATASIGMLERCSMVVSAETRDVFIEVGTELWRVNE